MPDLQVRSICVFCGASVGEDPAFRAAAEDLGRLIAKHNLRLIFGAGSVGLMGTVANAVLAGGGETIGVIPEFSARPRVISQKPDRTSRGRQHAHPQTQNV